MVPAIFTIFGHFFILNFFERLTYDFCKRWTSFLRYLYLIYDTSSQPPCCLLADITDLEFWLASREAGDPCTTIVPAFSTSSQPPCCLLADFTDLEFWLASREAGDPCSTILPASITTTRSPPVIVWILKLGPNHCQNKVYYSTLLFGRVHGLQAKLTACEPFIWGN